jgi:hypothetical protein
MLKSFVWFSFLVTMCFFVLEVHPGCSKKEIPVDTQIDTSIELYFEDTSSFELSQCLTGLSEYKKCCQECLVKKVDKTVNIKSR